MVATPQPYSPDELQRIAALLREGHSASQIASQIEGRTRSAIIGLVHRNEMLKAIGFSTQGVGYKVSRPRPSKPKPERRVRVSTASRSVPTRKSHSVRKRYTPRGKAQPEIPVPEPMMAQLEDLRNDQCRWPIGDPLEPGFGFCGHLVIKPGCYCPAHAQRSRTQPYYTFEATGDE
jgi:GcrA cell cycle regulator